MQGMVKFIVIGKQSFTKADRLLGCISYEFYKTCLGCNAGGGSHGWWHHTVPGTGRGI